MCAHDWCDPATPHRPCPTTVDPRDPHAWLEDGASPETLGWLEQRDREFARHRARWPLRRWLSAEIRRLVSTDDYSLPQLRAGVALTAHRPGTAEHPRLVATTTETTWTVFDPETVDPSGRTTLDAWETAPTGDLVAVQTSRDGTELGQLDVLDIASGDRVEPPITGVRYSHVAWLPSGGGAYRGAFYYVRRDGVSGQRGVWLHRVAAAGTANGHRGTDVLIRPCTDTAGVPGVRLERDRWLIITESHGTGHREDVWIADLDDPASTPEAPRLREVHAGVDVVSEPRVGTDGWLYLRTNLAAPRRRVCRVDPSAPGVGNWREVVPEESDATQDGFAVRARARGGLEVVVARTSLGISSLWAHDPETGRAPRQIALPGDGMVTRLECMAAGNDPKDIAASPHGESVWITFSGVSVPQRVLRRSQGRWSPWPGPAAGGGQHTPVYRRLLWCRSMDGAHVPVTVLSALPFGPRRPTILHAYGAYGRPRQFGFSATVLAWLRAGGQYAVAHVRGGGDLGRQWHLAGARRNKPASVADLLAATDELTDAGYCSRRQLCLSGGSAGGLLVLAAMARRPGCCGTVLASAPLADMLGFERLGLGVLWTREFGTVREAGDRAVLATYSPYHRVLDDDTGQAYPAVLLTGFHGDTRTSAAHPRKMCAALQRVTTNPALLRYEYGVGHGPRALSRAIDLAADAHAFVAAWTGLSPHGPVATDRSGTGRKGGEAAMENQEPLEISVEVEDLPEVTSRDTTAGGDTDGKDSSSDFI